MKIAAILLVAGALAACGQAEQKQAQSKAYSAPSSPDARGQPGYTTDPGIVNQQDTGAEGGRGSAATGATEQGLGDLPAGDTAGGDSTQQPERTP